MALLQDDFEPPLTKDDQKTKNLSQISLKIKNYFSICFSKLALAIIFLAGVVVNGGKKLLVLRAKITKRISSVFPIIQNHLPHIAIGFITFIVITSNFVIKYAQAHSNDYLVVNPSNEINLARDTEKFTPLIKDSAHSVEIAYAASTDDFTQTNVTVGTELTERVEPLPDNSASTVYYTVRDGDTLSMLGLKFNVKIATLKYLNDLGVVDLIKPGQQLKIPPSGYEISASVIAQKEKEKQAKLAKTNRNTSGGSNSKPLVNVKAGSRSNGYPYGYCTYWVALKRSMPTSMGNAKNWLNSARANGMATGSDPVTGSIAVTDESWWGHVAYVESVSDGNITLSEMNYNGWGVVSRRTIPANSGVVRGFIY